MGEQWSPKTEAASTVAMTLNSSSCAAIPSIPWLCATTQVVGIAIGYSLAIVLQLDPVEKEINADKINTIGGKR